jgi:hypothetical protein
VLLPDALGLDRTWWAVEAADVDRSPIREVADEAVIPSVDDRAELIGVVGDDPSRGMDIKVRVDFLESLEVHAEVGDKLIVAAGVGGDRERDYTSLREVAVVGRAGDVAFLGQCAEERLAAPLRSFHESVGWDGTEETLLRRLVVDEALRDRLDDHVYGTGLPGWDERAPESRSFLDDDVPLDLKRRLRTVLAVLDLHPGWLETDTLVCGGVRDIALGECLPLRDRPPRDPETIEVHVLEDHAVDFWLMSRGTYSDRLLIASLALTSDEVDMGQISLDMSEPPPDQLATLLAGDGQAPVNDWLHRTP